MARSPAAPTATPMSPAAPNPTPRSPAASTPTPRAPDASIPTPRWPPPPTSTPKSSAADLEEHKGTSELLRAIKIEKANGPDLEEHKGASEPHMEPPKCKKRKPSRQGSGELHGEHQETNKVVMKPSTSKKKRKASEEMCTNPPAPPLGPLAVDMDKQAPPLKKKRLNKRDVATTPSLGSLPVDKDKQPSLGSLPVDKNKQPSSGSLPIDKNKQPSSGSLPIDKNKQPSLSKKVVRSPVLNNVVVSFLARKEKKAKSLESSPSQPSLLALSPNVANLGSSRRRKLKSKNWNEVEPIYVDGILAQGRCTHCNQLFHASKMSRTSHIGKHLVVCEEKAKMDGMVAKIRTDSAIDPEWKFDPGRARRALVLSYLIFLWNSATVHTARGFKTGRKKWLMSVCYPCSEQKFIKIFWHL